MNNGNLNIGTNQITLSRDASSNFNLGNNSKLTFGPDASGGRVVFGTDGQNIAVTASIDKQAKFLTNNGNIYIDSGLNQDIFLNNNNQNRAINTWGNLNMNNGNLNIGTNKIALNKDGNSTINQGNNSTINFGPNASLGKLIIGASVNSVADKQAQVLSTDGNLHLDSGTNQDIYINHYNQNRSINTWGNLNMNNAKLTLNKGGEDVVADFRHSNLSQGIGIHYNTIRATGTNANQDINITPKGTGTVNVDSITNLKNDVNISGILYGPNWRLHRNDDNDPWVRLRGRFVPTTNTIDNHTNFAARSLYAHGNIEYLGVIAQASDIKLKENIKKIPNALEIINNIEGVTYNLKADEKKKNQYGYIAQDIEKVIPELITESSESNNKHVAYIGIIPILSEGIKQMVNENKNKITSKQFCINDTCINEDELNFLKQLYKQRY